MNSGLEQLLGYITQQLHHGVPEEQIRKLLLQSNWDAGLVDQAFSLVKNPALNTSTPQIAQQPTTQKHKVRNGVLWILSPFIVLVGNLLVIVIIRLAGISSPIINILSLIAGMVGVILIFVGPIMGIIKLASHK